jgi:hypothetical protein
MMEEVYRQIDDRRSGGGALARWEEFAQHLARAQGEPEYSGGELLKVRGQERYVIVPGAVPVTFDPTIERDWLQTCPRGWRSLWAFAPERKAKVFPLNVETGEVDWGNEVSPGKLFYKNIGGNEPLVIQGYKIVMASPWIAKQRKVDDGNGGMRNLFAKELIGAFVFGWISIEFGWSPDDQERYHQRWDETHAWKLTKALKCGFDSREDPRGPVPREQ